MPENVIASQNGHERMERTYSGWKKTTNKNSILSPPPINCMNVVTDLPFTVYYCVPRINRTLQNEKCEYAGLSVFNNKYIQIEWPLATPIYSFIVSWTCKIIAYRSIKVLWIAYRILKREHYTLLCNAITCYYYYWWPMTGWYLRQLRISYNQGQIEFFICNMHTSIVRYYGDACFSLFMRSNYHSNQPTNLYKFYNLLNSSCNIDALQRKGSYF